jgi:hypothetical protein
MKKIILFLLISMTAMTGVKAQSANPFPSLDSLIKFTNKWIRNNQADAFTNLRLNNILIGLSMFSKTSYGGQVVSFTRVGDTLRITTLDSTKHDVVFENGALGTDLSYTRNGTTVTVLSSSGIDVILPPVTQSSAGVATALDKQAIDSSTSLQRLRDSLLEVVHVYDTAAMLAGYMRKDSVPAKFTPIAGDNIVISGAYPNLIFTATGVVKYTDTSSMFTAYRTLINTKISDIQGLIRGDSTTITTTGTGTAGDPLILTSVGGGGGGTIGVVYGVTNRITVTNGTTTPTVDISAAYAGQNTITILGTVGTGTWQGTPITNAYLANSTISFATPGTSGTAPNWSSSPVSLGGTATLQIPMASATGVVAGLISKSQYDILNAKIGASDTTGKWISKLYRSNDSVYAQIGGSLVYQYKDSVGAGSGGGTVTQVNTGYGLSGGPITDTGTAIVDSATLALKFLRRADSITGYATPYDLTLKQDALGYIPENLVNKSTNPSLGTSNTLYPSQNAVKSYVDAGLALKQNSLSLTNVGTSGAATLVGSTLNIPIYSGTTYTAGVRLTLTGNQFNVDTAALLGPYQTALNTRVRYADTTSILSTYQTALNTKLNNITGYLSAGSNVTVTGLGTLASPYVIASSGGGGGSYIFTPADFNEAGSTISLDYTNGQKATTSLSGFLAASDWNIFNNKQNAITTGTTAQYLRGDLSLATFPTNVSTFTNDAAYLTNITGKLTAGSGINVTGSGTTAAPYIISSSALGLSAGDKGDITVVDATNWNIDALAVGNAEINDVAWSKITSVPTDLVYTNATQTLINKTLTSPKINVGTDATGDMYYRDASGNLVRLGIGSSGQVIKVVSGLPGWAADATSGGGGATLADGDYGSVTVSGTGTAINIDAGAVANSQLANMATLTIKGNNTGGTAAPQDLTVAQVNAILPVFTSSLNGLVPSSGGGTTFFLRADGTWAEPASGYSFETNDFNGTTTISIDYANGQKVTGSVPGFLTSADYTTLMAKQNAITTGTTAQYLRGDLSLATFPTTVSTFTNDAGYLTNITGKLTAGTNVSVTGLGTTASPYVINSTASGTGTVTNFAFTNGNGFTGSVSTATTTPTLSLVLQDADAGGTIKGQAGFTAADFNAASGIISMDWTNTQKANGSQSGALSSTDWTTFNGKQGAITVTNVGTSGAATLIGNTLNIPIYSGGSSAGLPPGGTAGQILSKINSTDYNAQWIPYPTFNVFAGYGILIDGENNISLDTSASSDVYMQRGNLVAGANITITPSGNQYVIASTGGAGVTDGDKTDITVSGSGAVYTLDPGVPATKLADGSVSNDELQYINTLASNAQTQIDGKNFNLGWLDAENYGARGDGKDLNSVAITSGDATLTSSGASFTSADIGKTIRVDQAGSSSGDLVTTIASINSSTSIELAANASTTVSGGHAVYGTDNTTPLQNAINAAAATTSAGTKTVFLRNGMYLIFGAPVTSVSGVNPNAQLYIPFNSISNTITSPSVNIVGETPPNLFIDFQANSFPTNQGVVIRSTRLDAGANIFGTPWETMVYGDYNYTHLHMENITIRARSFTGTSHVAPQMSALKMGKISMLTTKNCRFDTESPTYYSVTPNSSTVGIQTPRHNNADLSYHENIVVQGYYDGVDAGENSNFVNLTTMGNWNGVKLNTIHHAAKFSRASINLAVNNIYIEGQSFFAFDLADFEDWGVGGTGGFWFDNVYDLYDASPGNSQGHIRYQRVVGGVGYENDVFVKNSTASTFSIVPIGGGGGDLDATLALGNTSDDKMILSGSLTTDAKLRVGSMEFQPFDVNNGFISENLYYNGANFIRRAAGFGALQYSYKGSYWISSADSAAAGSTATVNKNFEVTQGGQIRSGPATTLNPSFIDPINFVSYPFSGSGTVFYGQSTDATARTQSILSNLGGGTTGTAWADNFITTMVNGKSYASDNYLNDGENDDSLAAIIAQGGDIGRFSIGMYNEKPMSLVTNNRERLVIKGDGAIILPPYAGFGTQNLAVDNDGNLVFGSGGGSSSLTNMYIGFGNGSNELSGASTFTFDNSTTKILEVNSSANSAGAAVLALETDAGTSYIQMYGSATSTYENLSSAGMNFYNTTTGGINYLNENSSGKISFQVGTGDPQLSLNTSGVTINSGSNSFTLPVVRSGVNGYVLKGNTDGGVYWGVDDTGSGGFSDPLTTNGDIITRISGSTTRLAAGTASYVLTSNGAGNNISWQPVPGSGQDAQHYTLFGTTSGTSTLDVSGSVPVSNGESGYFEVTVYAINSTSSSSWTYKYRVPYLSTSSSTITFGTVVPESSAEVVGSGGMAGSTLDHGYNGSGDMIFAFTAGETSAVRIEIKKYVVSWAG